MSAIDFSRLAVPFAAEAIEDAPLSDVAEEWRPIPGYAGRYSASSHGRVCSEPRTEYTACYPNGRRYQGKVLRTWINEFGYECVRLTLPAGEGKPHTKVHRLVCAAFHGQPPSAKHEPNHINHARTDNRPCNLEWVTRAQNIQYAYDSGRRDTAKNAKGERVGNAKLTASGVQDIRQRFGGGEDRRSIAADYGITPHYVRTLFLRRAWAHVP